MCTNMQTHTHGLLFCSVSCIPWWVAQRHVFCRGRDMYQPTRQLLRCTPAPSPAAPSLLSLPSFCDTAFLSLPLGFILLSHLLSKTFSTESYSLMKLDPCVTFPIWPVFFFLLSSTFPGPFACQIVPPVFAWVLSGFSSPLLPQCENIH